MRYPRSQTDAMNCAFASDEPVLSAGVLGGEQHLRRAAPLSSPGFRISPPLLRDADLRTARRLTAPRLCHGGYLPLNGAEIVIRKPKAEEAEAPAAETA